MRTKNFLLILFLAGSLLAFAGCQRSPADRIADTQRDLDKAVKEQADRYAASEFTTAQETLRRARAENDRRNYETANQLAADADKQVKVAMQTADKNKKDMKDYLKKAIDEAHKVIDQTKEEYTNAQKLHVPEGDLAAANAEISSAETELKQANDILDSGDIITARDKVKDAQGRLMNAQQRIRNLVAVKAAPYKR